jgi:tRNA pseudouridine38-40 synthase
MHIQATYSPERVETPLGVRFGPPPGTRNIKMVLSYHGAAFHGYQIQPNGITVQEVLIKAWNTLTGEHPTFYGCSRLDAGVHANEFVLNLYSATTLPWDRLVRALNGIIANHFRVPLRIYKASEADPFFNARFDAAGKHYRYLLWKGMSEHALLVPRCWNLRSKQNPRGLATALHHFEGTRDFAAFRAQDCAAKTTVRTIQRIDCWQHPRFDECSVIDVWGEGFLKNMIRNIVGTAVDVSLGKFPPTDIESAFSHGVRSLVGQCAPAHALSLERVFYGEDELLSSAQLGARNFIPS